MSGRIAIISDIHSNLEALTAVLEDLREQKAEVLYCLGDVVGYGANPSECLALTRKVAPVILKGNHDAAVAGGPASFDFNDAAQAAVAWTRKQMSADDLTFLAGLPYVHEIPERSMVLAHATPGEPEAFHYLLFDVAPSEALAGFSARFGFVGHSHVPGVYMEKAGRVSEMALSVTLDPDARYLVNVGSVGQPRDHIPLSAYCLLDFDVGSLTIRRVEYDIPGAQQKILDAGLPPALAARLSFGV